MVTDGISLPLRILLLLLLLPRRRRCPLETVNSIPNANDAQPAS